MTSVCQTLGEGLRDTLQTKVIEACDIAYLSDEVLPLLVTIAGILCTAQPRPKAPKAFVLMWAAEQLGLPEELQRQLRQGVLKLTDDEASAPVPSGEAAVPAAASTPPGSVSTGPEATSATSAASTAATNATATPTAASTLAGTEELVPKPPEGRPTPGRGSGRDRALRVAEDKEAEDMKQNNSASQESQEQSRKRYMHKKSQALRNKRPEAMTETAQEKQEMSNEDIISLLHTVPSLQKVSKPDLQRIANICQTDRWEQDEIIVHCGQIEDHCHIVVEGSGLISVPQFCGNLAWGDSTGEESLRIPGIRSRTQITAMEGGVMTLSVPRGEFEALNIMKGMFEKSKKKRVAAQDSIEAELQQGKKDGLGRRSTAKLPDCNQMRCLFSGLVLSDDQDMSTHSRGMIMQGIATNKILGEVVSLSQEQREMIVSEVHLVEAPAHKDIVRKGDKGAAFFIVQEGYLQLCVGDGHTQITLRHGDTFGELALLYDEPRAATITSLVDCKLWVLPQPSFREVAQLSAKRRLADLAKVLHSVPMLVTEIDTTLFDMLAGVIEEVTFFEGDALCLEGEDQGTFFLLQEGECEAQATQTVFKKGAWLGEEQLTANSKATMTVHVTSDVASVLILEHDDFKMVQEATHNLQNHKAGSPHAVFRNHVKKVMTKMQGLNLLAAKKAQEARPALDRCEVVGALGEGSYGLVLLLRDKTSKCEYALKAISKDQIAKEGSEEGVANERRLMDLFTSDFIVKLHKSYEDPEFIYLMLDSIFGGELFDVYSDQDLWGKIEHARFYIANVTVGLSHLHEKRVVWRDLKLENCLVDSLGYLKLTDLGIAKMVIGKTYTVCGTVDYFAPETLRQLGTNRAADWWAAGVLLFIMIAGRSPFDAPEVPQIYKNIIKGMAKVEFPRNCNPEVKDVIISLCKKKPEDRVTMQKGGVTNLKNMPFFEELNWDDLLHRRAKAPWVPSAPDYEKISKKKLSREVDVNFDKLQELDNVSPS